MRHWRRHGTGPLPTGAEALDEPFDAFPSWFLRVTCARCGQERMVNQVHAAKSDLPLRDILAKMRHDGCGGRAGKAELLSGVEGVSSRPVRRILLRETLSGPATTMPGSATLTRGDPAWWFIPPVCAQILAN